MPAKKKSKGKPAKQPAKLSDAEKIARYEEWASLIANAGNYKIEGGAVILRPSIAKSVAFMEGPGQTYNFKLDGDVLWLTLKTTGKEASDSPTIKLQRLE